MKAVVFDGIGAIRLDTVPEPKLEKPSGAIVRLTASVICGTDLHMVRGTMPGKRMKSGVSSRTDTGFHSGYSFEDTAAELWSRRPQPPRRFRPLPQRKSELTPVSALATTHSRFR